MQGQQMKCVEKELQGTRLYLSASSAFCFRISTKASQFSLSVFSLMERRPESTTMETAESLASHYELSSTKTSWKVDKLHGK